MSRRDLLRGAAVTVAGAALPESAAAQSVDTIDSPNVPSAEHKALLEYFARLRDGYKTRHSKPVYFEVKSFANVDRLTIKDAAGIEIGNIAAPFVPERNFKNVTLPMVEKAIQNYQPTPSVRRQ